MIVKKESCEKRKREEDNDFLSQENLNASKRKKEAVCVIAEEYKHAKAIVDMGLEIVNL